MVTNLNQKVIIIAFTKSPDLKISLFSIFFFLVITDATYTTKTVSLLWPENMLLSTKSIEMMFARSFWIARNLIGRERFPEYFDNNMAPFRMLSSIQKRKYYACVLSILTLFAPIYPKLNLEVTCWIKETLLNRREISGAKYFWIWF